MITPEKKEQCEFIDKMIHDQKQLILMMGNDPTGIQLEPSIYKQMCDYWTDQMLASPAQKKVMLQISTYDGLPVQALDNIHMSGVFVRGSGICPPVMVTYKKREVHHEG